MSKLVGRVFKEAHQCSAPKLSREATFTVDPQVFELIPDCRGRHTNFE